MHGQGALAHPGSNLRAQADYRTVRVRRQRNDHLDAARWSIRDDRAKPCPQDRRPPERVKRYAGRITLVLTLGGTVAMGTGSDPFPETIYTPRNRLFPPRLLPESMAPSLSGAKRLPQLNLLRLVSSIEWVPPSEHSPKGARTGHSCADPRLEDALGLMGSSLRTRSPEPSGGRVGRAFPVCSPGVRNQREHPFLRPRESGC